MIDGNFTGELLQKTKELRRILSSNEFEPGYKKKNVFVFLYYRGEDHAGLKVSRVHFLFLMREKCKESDRKWSMHT